MSEKAKKFTQDNVHSIKPPAGKADHWVADGGLPGFFIRFQRGGEGCYFIRYSIHGRERKMQLGKVSQIKLADAQKLARRHFGMVADDADPMVERAKVTVESGITIPSLLPGFRSHLENKRRSQAYIDRTMDYLEGSTNKAGEIVSEYLRPLHKIPLGQLNRATVASELNKLEKNHGPIAMTRARAALSKFISYCFTQGHEIANPVKGTTKYESEERNRVLMPDELVAIWQTAGDDDYGRLVRLMMLTAARRTQMGDLKKIEVKAASSEIPTQDRLIELPGQRRKNSRKGGSKHADTFLIPLSTQALTILAEKEKAPRDGEYVFGDGGKGGFSGWSKCKERHCQRIGKRITEPWGFHDFRRSFETLGHDVVKIPEVDLDHCINHKPQSKKGVRSRYNYAKHLDEKRAAMQKWGDYIEGLLRQKPKLAAVSKAA